MVRARWWLGMNYILARHKLTRWLGRSQDESLDEWTGENNKKGDIFGLGQPAGYVWIGQLSGYC